MIAISVTREEDPCGLAGGLDDLDGGEGGIQAGIEALPLVVQQQVGQLLDFIEPAVGAALQIIGVITGFGNGSDGLDAVGAVFNVDIALLTLDLEEVDAPSVLGADIGADKATFS